MAIIDSTLTSRYELKYVIKPSQVDSIQRYCEPFVKQDLFSEGRELGYQITSLYLDTEDLACYEATEDGHKNRFKLRIRTYSETEGPVFFEIKKRLGRLIRKSRARVDREAAHQLLAGRIGDIRSRIEQPSQDFQEFLHFSQRDDHYPVAFVRYQRQAYESLGIDPVRITFDHATQYAVAHEASLSTVGLEWRPAPISGVVLELKFTNRCPSWAVDMVRVFQLHRRSVSKYGRSVRDALNAEIRLPAAVPGTSTMAIIAP